MTHIPRIGIGGPVGSGKSMLIERMVPMLAKEGYSVSIISNDVISKEDADRMRANLATEKGTIPPWEPMSNTDLGFTSFNAEQIVGASDSYKPRRPSSIILAMPSVLIAFLINSPMSLLLQTS